MRTPLIVIAGIGLLCIGIVWAEDARAAESSPAPAFHSMSGSYFVAIDLDGSPVGLPASIPIQSLLGLHRGSFQRGTVTAADITDFGGVAGFAGFDGSGHGAWRRTGYREVTLRYIALTFDAAGAPSGTQTIRAVIDIQQGAGNGVATVEQFALGEDPLTGSPLFTLSATVAVRRIGVN
ncbi:MAG: hypothetical protein CMJ83_08505 [Planctomycetes bacterium]|nr:hypothetical protein [Planctomycetota bacterium]